MVDFKDLAKAGVHFGHQTSRWNPKMAPYIWGHRNGVHLIDVSKTAVMLERAAKFLESVAAQGKQILWVGTKKPAQAFVAQARDVKMPSVTHRWIGGTLTNNLQVRKSITRLLHYEDILEKSEKFPYNKKELGVFQKIAHRLEKNIGGIRNLRWPVGAVVLVDVRKEQTALKEAVSMGIPVVSLVDTNGDPYGVDYVIPGNDDSPRAIKIILDYLLQAAQKGQEIAARKKEEKLSIAVIDQKKVEPKQAEAKQESNKQEEIISAPKEKSEKSTATSSATPKKKAVPSRTKSRAKTTK